MKAAETFERTTSEKKRLGEGGMQRAILKGKTNYEPTAAMLNRSKRILERKGKEVEPFPPLLNEKQTSPRLLKAACKNDSGKVAKTSFFQIKERKDMRNSTNNVSLEEAEA